MPPSAGARPVVRTVVFGVVCCAARGRSPLRGGWLLPPSAVRVRGGGGCGRRQVLAYGAGGVVRRRRGVGRTLRLPGTWVSDLASTTTASGGGVRGFGSGLGGLEVVVGLAGVFGVFSHDLGGLVLVAFADRLDQA